MAVSAAAMLLDELMGRDRNLAPTEKRREVRWDDPETCKYFLCGFCPHELFVNTRADLGPCDKIHDDELKKGYVKSSRFERMGYEEEFMRFLQSLLADVERRIKRGHARLALNSAQGGLSGNPAGSKEDQLEVLTARINSLVEEAEQLGCEGKVEEAQSVMRLCEQMREERSNCEQADKKGKSREEEMAKKMEVCNVCGALLVAGDAQQRIDEHIMGKQHMGYARIRAYIEQRHSGVPTDETAGIRMEKERIERERLVEEEEIKRLELELEREKERRRRSRSRSSTRSSRHRRSRSGSRGRRGGDRDREHGRTRDREREGRRDRSHERRRHSRSRDRSRDREHGHDRKRSRSRSRRSHSKSSSRRSSRDRADRDRRRSRSRSKARRSRSRSRDRKEKNRKSAHSSRDKDRDAEKGDSSERWRHNGRDTEEDHAEEQRAHLGDGDATGVGGPEPGALTHGESAMEEGAPGGGPLSAVTEGDSN